MVVRLPSKIKNQKSKMNLHPNASKSAHKLRPLDALVRDARFLLRRRRAGKIAKLPEPVREQINTMLQDGVPYAMIIARLGEAGQGINIHNLSRWRRADYQDWLAEQTWQATIKPGTNASPQAKDLTLLLHHLDAQPLASPASLQKAAFVRHINLIAKFVDQMTAHRTPLPNAPAARPPQTLRLNSTDRNLLKLNSTY